MPGAIALVFILVVVIPVTVCMSGSIVAAALGWALKADAEKTHEGSELIDLNI